MILCSAGDVLKQWLFLPSLSSTKWFMLKKHLGLSPLFVSFAKLSLRRFRPSKYSGSPIWTRGLYFPAILMNFYHIAGFSCTISPTGEHSNFNLFPQHTMLKNSVCLEMMKKERQQDEVEADASLSEHPRSPCPGAVLQNRCFQHHGQRHLLSAPQHWGLLWVRLFVLFFVLFFNLWDQTCLCLESCFHTFSIVLSLSGCWGNRHVDGCLHSSSLQLWEWRYLSHSDCWGKFKEC